MGSNTSKRIAKKVGDHHKTKADTPHQSRKSPSTKPEIVTDKVYKLVMLGDGGVGKTGNYF